MCRWEKQKQQQKGIANYFQYPTAVPFSHPLLPSDPQIVPTNTSIPAYPMAQPDGSSTYLGEAPGDVGIMANGVALYGYGTSLCVCVCFVLVVHYDCFSSLVFRRLSSVPWLLFIAAIMVSVWSPPHIRVCG